MLIRILGVALLAVTLTTTQAEKYLTKKPDDLVPCSVKDAKFNECLAKNLQTIFINWKDGIPHSDIVGPIDPFTTKVSNLTSLFPGHELFSIDLDLKDVVVKGMSKATIKEASYDPVKHNAKVMLKIPKLIFDFNYIFAAKAPSEIFKFHTEGKTTFELAYILMELDVQLKPRVTPEATFFDVLQVKASFKQDEDDNSDLRKAFEKLMKDEEDYVDWEDLAVIVEPVYEWGAEAKLLNRVKKILSYIPATYIIDNVH